ncbi:MAG: hypothetical protein ABEJ59_04820 [Halanaeroarchaeum sp.]
MNGESRSLETRRIGLFVLVAFGVAWVTGGVIYATGGLVDSPTVVSVGGISLSLAGVLLPTTYMFAPAVGNVVTRLSTDEGWADLLVRPRLTGSLRYYAAGWLAPLVLTVLGAGLFFAVFPQYFDPSLSTFGRALAEQLGQSVDPLTVAALQIGAALTIAPVINALFAFGEEFGWRAYPLPKLVPLGTRRAILILGVVWGAGTGR